MVVGIGVKNSTSDLLTANCDEFIFYDDLVRGRDANRKKRRPGRSKKKSDEKNATKGEEEDRSQEAFDLVFETVEALIEERGGDETLWGSMVKQALRRRKPGFNESYYGFRSFNRLLEETSARHPLELIADEKSGGYVIKAS